MRYMIDIDECCLVFTRGYSYQSKYQGLKNYAFFMRNSAPQEDQIEFPMPVQGQEIKSLPLESESTVETVCLLSKQNKNE